MEFALYVTCCFSLADFNVLSLCFVSVSLISMCLGMFLLGFILHGILFAYWTWLSPFPNWGNFNYNLFKNFLIPFRFVFFFWNPYNLKGGALDIVPKVSETILISFILFTLFCSLEIFSTIFFFQLTESFFCFRYSSINSF